MTGLAVISVTARAAVGLVNRLAVVVAVCHRGRRRTAALASDAVSNRAAPRRARCDGEQ